MLKIDVIGRITNIRSVLIKKKEKKTLNDIISESLAKCYRRQVTYNAL